MAALGWLLNLGFAGSGPSGAPPTFPRGLSAIDMGVVAAFGGGMSGLHGIGAGIIGANPGTTAESITWPDTSAITWPDTTDIEWPYEAS